MYRKLLMIMALVLLVSTGGSCDKQDTGTSAISGWERMGHEDDPSDDSSEDPSGEDPSGDDASKDPDAGRWFKTRGIVAGWTDVYLPNSEYYVDYLKIAKEHHLNTFSIYGADRSSQSWKDFMVDAGKIGVKFEFQEHMMYFLLPRDLFDSHPEYFRQNKNGVRTNDANGCPSSEGALEQVYIHAIDIGSRYEPTNHKYYFWLDDGGDICYCDKCKDLSASDQALIFENKVLEALKTLDPDAKLAHLAYNNTTEAPKTIKPSKDIFLEFAPFHRNWEHPLSETWVEGNSGWTHARYIRVLQENLKVFPKETAQVLEYWMDDSLFSGWKPENLKEVPWSKKIFLDDLKTYAKYGIQHMTCYCAYVGPNYFKKFGYPYFLEEYADGLWEFQK